MVLPLSVEARRLLIWVSYGCHYQWLAVWPGKVTFHLSASKVKPEADAESSVYGDHFSPFFFWFQTGSPVAQAGLKLALEPRMTLHFGSSCSIGQVLGLLRHTLCR